MEMTALYGWCGEQAHLLATLDKPALLAMRDNLHQEGAKDFTTMEQDLKIIITLGMIDVRLRELEVQTKIVQPPSGFQGLF